jgi:spore coat protein U-like protein
LDYELYSDGGRTQVWGSTEVPQTISISPSGSGEATATIFARVFGGQSTVPVGSYSRIFSGSDVTVRYGLQTGSETCTSITGTATASFTVTANVTPQCTLTTSDINFGTVGELSNPVTASGTVTVRCTSNAGYTISMDGGISKSTDPTRRWMGGTTPQTGVSYGLYQNSDYSLPWGNTPGLTKTDTGSGIDKIFTVYGRTNPSTITPPADTYNDTVIVTVTY